ncbi:NAD(P)-dependent dehydrogenase (short-subunit alcohol dehydrogenase family) [Cytobacillus purgationiresistens]|uniref:NAD(P)-dependent dehydrogenase (Short-subunit alcohol dehydrogenase family) n=1 Tax=Cytobacillus purgationiresistens TaxID=863449 RepID=A0ABU0AM08_9BACI|nr:NAD(P)-dependent dehydrogenase (short-subunit alcohol dehydrogenase family) [Cytobacillus purgationiresistens]
MEKQQKGSIVNISSYTAQVGMGLNAYTASKGAVRAISKAAAAQFGHSGIRVNALFPGIINTPMTKGLETSGQVLEQLLAMTPLQRLGEPEDIAKAALYLASDDASFVTGAELVIDGGFTAH